MDKIQLTKVELEAKIDAGDSEVMNAYLEGRVEIVEEGAETKESEKSPAEGTEDTPTTHSQEEIESLIPSDFKNPIPTPTASDDEEDEEDDKLEALKAQYEAKIKELEKRVPAILDEDEEEELEYASKITLNTRRMVADLKADLQKLTGTADISNLAAKIQKMENADLERQKIEEKERKDTLAKEARNKVFNEVRLLQERAPYFQTKNSIDNLYENYVEFKKNVASVIKVEDTNLINKAVYSAIRGEDESAKNLQKALSLAGVNTLDEGAKYLDILDIIDAKNGVKFNVSSGKYDTITDDFGNPVKLRSLQDAYKLSNYYQEMTSVGKEVARDIQKKLDILQNSAQTLDNSQVSDNTERGTSLDEMRTLLEMPSDVIKKNPELRAKLNKYLAGK